MQFPNPDELPFRLDDPVTLDVPESNSYGRVTGIICRKDGVRFEVLWLDGTMTGHSWIELRTYDPYEITLELE